MPADLGAPRPLADPDLRRRDKFIGRYREVRARWAAANATREIETRGVTGTNPALAGSRHACTHRRLQSAAKVRADADYDQPLLMARLRAIAIARRGVFPQRIVAGMAVGELRHRHAAGKVHLSRCAVPNGDRQSSPGNGFGLSRIDCLEVDLARLGRWCTGMGVHLRDKGPKRCDATHSLERNGSLHDQISPSRMPEIAEFAHDAAKTIAS